MITSAKLIRDEKGTNRGFGFVCFSTPEEANKAVNNFHVQVEGSDEQYQQVQKQRSLERTFGPCKRLMMLAWIQ
ncbi:hypothetical protein ACSBR2_014859 [Camellia fascicularis]